MTEDVEDDFPWVLWLAALFVIGMLALFLIQGAEIREGREAEADLKPVMCGVSGERVPPVDASPRRAALDHAANMELVRQRLEWDAGLRPGPFPRWARGCPEVEEAELREAGRGR